MGDHRSVAVVTVTLVLISLKKPLKIQGQFLDLDLIVEMVRWANLKSKLTEYGTRYHKTLVYWVMTLRKGVPQKMLTLPRSGNLATSLHNRLGLIALDGSLRFLDFASYFICLQIFQIVFSTERLIHQRPNVPDTFLGDEMHSSSLHWN